MTVTNDSLDNFLGEGIIGGAVDMQSGMPSMQDIIAGRFRVILSNSSDVQPAFALQRNINGLDKKNPFDRSPLQAGNGSNAKFLIQIAMAAAIEDRITNAKMAAMLAELNSIEERNKFLNEGEILLAAIRENKIKLSPQEHHMLAELGIEKLPAKDPNNKEAIGEQVAVLTDLVGEVVTHAPAIISTGLGTRPISSPYDDDSFGLDPIMQDSWGLTPGYDFYTAMSESIESAQDRDLHAAIQASLESAQLYDLNAAMQASLESTELNAVIQESLVLMEDAEDYDLYVAMQESLELEQAIMASLGLEQDCDLEVEDLELEQAIIASLELEQDCDLEVEDEVEDLELDCELEAAIQASLELVQDEALPKVTDLGSVAEVRGPAITHSFNKTLGQLRLEREERERATRRVTALTI